MRTDAVRAASAAQPSKEKRKYAELPMGKAHREFFLHIKMRIVFLCSMEQKEERTFGIWAVLGRNFVKQKPLSKCLKMLAFRVLSGRI